MSITQDEPTTAVEQAVAAMERRPGTDPGPAAPHDRARAPRDAVRAPRVRVTPPGPRSALATADALTVPPLLGERVLAQGRARHLGPLDEEERGAAPSTDAGRFAHGVGLACVEVLLGSRPAAQLARWVVPEVLDSLLDGAQLVRRAGARAHVRRPLARRVRTCPVGDHAAEACLIVDDGHRVRAVALRLEAHRGSWRVVSLQIG